MPCAIRWKPAQRVKAGEIFRGREIPRATRKNYSAETSGLMCKSLYCFSVMGLGDCAIKS